MKQERHDIKSQVADVGGVCNPEFLRYLMLAIAVVLNLALVKTAMGQDVYVQTGFEEFAAGNPPDDWEFTGGDFEVTRDTVKTGKKSLVILGGADGDGLGAPIETENPIISVEFWVYVEGGGRSFNLKVASADNIGENNGGTYINWDAGIVRLYDGAAWQPIGEFETDIWKYVRIIANFDKSEFDFYVGDRRDAALAAKPEKGLAFRNAVWGMTAPGYVDDLLVYEGAEPLNLAVDPGGKLATFWGEIKRRR